MAWNTLPEEAGLDKEVGKQGSGAKCGRAFWGVWASEQADLDPARVHLPSCVRLGVHSFNK